MMVAMIKPTIGRVVWYHPASGEPVTDQPQAALVTYVWSDICVNLAVFDADGVASNQTSVLLWDSGSDIERPSQRYCEWMPYQQGQAAKTEALEKEAALYAVPKD
jgi:hypothetical protein